MFPPSVPFRSMFFEAQFLGIPAFKSEGKCCVASQLRFSGRGGSRPEGRAAVCHSPASALHRKCHLTHLLFTFVLSADAQVCPSVNAYAVSLLVDFSRLITAFDQFPD